MAIRFSAARNGSCPILVRALCPSVPLCAANDNSPARARLRRRIREATADTANERIFAEALRHFARHGLSAAAHARAHAALPGTKCPAPGGSPSAASSTAAWPMPSPSASPGTGERYPTKGEHCPPARSP